MCTARGAVCRYGYYHGWIASEATVDACTASCLNDPRCKFAALMPGETCSKYDEGAGDCSDRGHDPEAPHTLFGKTESTCP